MTRDEKLKAFEMRMDGATYKQISEKLFYDEEAIRQMFFSVLASKRKPPKIVFPAVRDFVVKNYEGSIRSFAYAAGYSESAIRKCLSYQMNVSEKIKKRICEVTGMSESEAFKLE